MQMNAHGQDMSWQFYGALQEPISYNKIVLVRAQEMHELVFFFAFFYGKNLMHNMRWRRGLKLISVCKVHKQVLQN